MSQGQTQPSDWAAKIQEIKKRILQNSSQTETTQKEPEENKE